MATRRAVNTKVSIRVGTNLGFLAVICLGPVLQACTMTGDFGRPKANFIHTTAAPYAGKSAQLARDEPTSFLPLTDAEKSMRERAYTIVVPTDILGERRSIQPYVRYQAILPQKAGFAPVDSYYYRIMGLRAKSSDTPHRRVIDDIRKDRAAIPGFRASAARVLDHDGLRLERTMGGPGVDPKVADKADNRIAENSRMIWFTVETLNHRLDQYRFAIDNLDVVAPSHLAGTADAALDRLASDVNALDQALLARLDTKEMKALDMAYRKAPMTLQRGRGNERANYSSSAGAHEYSLDRVR